MPHVFGGGRVASWGFAANVVLWRLLALVALMLLLGGCAQQRIREEAQDLLRTGDYERAIVSYEDGLKEYPDSALLRSGLIRARSDALALLVAQAAAHQSSGDLSRADETLKRAAGLDPGNTRVNALLQRLELQRGQQAALAEAKQLVEAGNREAALHRVREALKNDPRDAELQGLARRIEMELRQQQVQQGVAALSERRPISLDFRDASLRTVLDLVSRNSGINFVMDKDIRQDVRITVYLRDVAVEDAIDLIASTHQLAKKVLDARTVLIYPNTPEKRREHQEQLVRVFYLASAEAKGAAAFLKSMMRIADPFVDERSNMLAIRDSHEAIQLAERLVSLYDTHEPEVLLEVEVLEIRSTRLLELGIKFPEAFSLTPLPPPGAAGLTLGNVAGINSDRIGLNVPGVSFNLKRDVGDFNILANPRIRAKNKEKASILIGDKVPVITATTGTGGFVSDSVSYLDVGLKLDVEPTVYADDEVAIKIAMEVSSLGTQIRTASGSLAYQIGTRNATTLLRLRDGETQLLAGLISNEDRSSASRVPGIGDLPVLGRLFSSQRDDSTRTELVLAITPRVLRNIRPPLISETELWVGTETQTRLRPVGGRVMSGPSAAPGTPSQPTWMAGAAVDRAEGMQRQDPNAPGKPLALRWTGTGQGKVGATVEVALVLQSAVPLRGVPLEFGFDRDRLEWIGVEEGDYFRQGNVPTSFTHEVKATDGRVRLGVIRNQATGASGEGRVATLKFKALKPGAAPVTLLSMEPMFVGDTAPMPALPQSWRILVE